jgi:outer membrane protein OmpA-like peptidoglycan-associated protein
MQPWPLLLVAALGLAPLSAAQAQDRSADELRALFESQIETFRAARETPGLGASRGLILAPVAAQPVEAVRVAPAAPVALAPAPKTPSTSAPTLDLAAPGGAAPAAPGASTPGLELAAPAMPGAAAPDQVAAIPAGVAPETVSHWILPEEQQVNLRVNFAFDSAAIAEPEKPKLRELCAVIEAAGVEHFRIIGHTDATGDARYNQRLSVQRAEEVKQFFIDDCGIAAGRLEAIGVGMQFPFNESDPRGGENRRVEFQAIS